MLVQRAAFPRIFALVERAEGKRLFQEMRGASYDQNANLNSGRRFSISLRLCTNTCRKGQFAILHDRECPPHRVTTLRVRVEGWAAAGTRQPQISVLG